MWFTFPHIQTSSPNSFAFRPCNSLDARNSLHFPFLMCQVDQSRYDAQGFKWNLVMGIDPVLQQCIDWLLKSLSLSFGGASRIMSGHWGRGPSLPQRGRKGAQPTAGACHQHRAVRLSPVQTYLTVRRWSLKHDLASKNCWEALFFTYYLTFTELRKSSHVKVKS